MPRIPVFESQLRTPDAPSAGAAVRVQIDDPLRGVAEPLVHGLLKLAEDDARTYAGKVAADSHLQWTEEFNKRQKEAEPGAPDFTPTILKDFDEYSSKAIEQATTPMSKKFVAQHLQALRTSLGDSAIKFEGEARVSQRIDSHKNDTENWAKVIATDPSEEKVALARTTLEQTRPDVGHAQREVLKDFEDKTLRTAAWASLAERDPRRVIAVVDEVFGKIGGYGTRADGTQKGKGFLGELKRPDGAVSTELSIGVNIDGKEIEIPSLVPTLTKAEVNTLLSLKDSDKMPQSIVDKAVAHARQRLAAGKSVFSDDGVPLDANAKPDGFGGVVGITPIGELLHWKNAAQQQLTKEEQTSHAFIELQISNAKAMAQTGTAPTTPVLPREAFNVYKDPVIQDVKYAEYTTARATAATVASFQNKSNDELVGILNTNLAGASMNKTPGKTKTLNASDPFFAVTAGGLEIKQRAAGQILEARMKDPVGYGLAQGQFGLRPLDMDNLENFGAELKTRVAALPGMQAQYGNGVQILSAGERAVFAAKLDAVPALNRVQMLKQTRQAIGDDNVFRGLMQSVRPDSPVTAMVANITTVGGSLPVGDAAIPVEKVAVTMSIGEDLLNKTKAGRASDGGKGSNFPMPPDKQMHQFWLEKVGNAYASNPEVERTSYEAFRAYYAGKSSQKGGIDPNAGVDSKIADEAIVAATGGVTQWGSWGSRSPLILPYGMPADKFKDTIAVEWGKLQKEHGYVKTPYTDIKLRPISNGVYQVMSGDTWMPGKDGRALTIDLNSPDAYRAP